MTRVADPQEWTSLYAGFGPHRAEAADERELHGDVQRWLDERGKKPDTTFFLYYALNLPHANNEGVSDPRSSGPGS
jgi:hypothetical protein